MNHIIEKNIVIVGAGRLGRSVATGFIETGVNSGLINLIQRNKDEKRIEVNCRVYESLEEADLGDNIEVVIIAVKPRDMDSVLPIVDRMVKSDIPIVSLAAQITVGELKRKLPNRSGVFRIKPNVMVRHGYGCILIHNQDDEPQYKKVRSIFARLGEVFELAESELDIYSWYGIHIPCVLIPKLIQSMLEGKSADEKQRVFPILVSGLEGMLRYLKASEGSALNLEDLLADLVDLTMSPSGVNEKALSYLEKNGTLTTINEAREVYIQAGIGKNRVV